MLIFFCDNDRDSLYLFKAFAKKLGHECIGWDGPSGFVDALLEVQPDLAFIDARMSPTSGLEIVDRLRELKYNGKIALMSAHWDISDMRGQLEKYEAIEKLPGADGLKAMIKKALR